MSSKKKIVKIINKHFPELCLGTEDESNTSFAQTMNDIAGDFDQLLQAERGKVIDECADTTLLWKIPSFRKTDAEKAILKVINERIDKIFQAIKQLKNK